MFMVVIAGGVVGGLSITAGIVVERLLATAFCHQVRIVSDQLTHRSGSGCVVRGYASIDSKAMAVVFVLVDDCSAILRCLLPSLSA